MGRKNIFPVRFDDKVNKYWKQYNQWVGFHDLPFILLGVPFISVLVSMIFFGYNLGDAFLCFWLNIIPSYISTLVFWLGDRQITIWFRKKFPSPHQWRERMFKQGLVILAYTAIMSVALLFSKTFYSPVDGKIMEHPGYWKSFVTCLFATVPILAIYEAAYFINHWKLSVAEAEKLKQQITESQLEALKSQITPHFLFNSLNTLASLIPEEPKAAVDFVHGLSNVYRTILDLKERTVVTLEEELEFLSHYNYLLKSRFGENLVIAMDIDPVCRTCYLVPLSLQMLVENAVKHNIASSKKPLTITISNEGYHAISVTNNLQPKSQISESTGTGLKNIENRFKLTFALPIQIKEDEKYFKVILPLIPIENYQPDHKPVIEEDN